MPRSLDFVGPRRCSRVIKECKLFGLKPSWKEFPKEGDLQSQGIPGSHWLCLQCSPCLGAMWSEDPIGHPRNPQMAPMRDPAFESLKLIPGPQVRSPNQHYRSQRLHMNHYLFNLFFENGWIFEQIPVLIFYYNKQPCHDNCFIYILCILAHFIPLGEIYNCRTDG